MQSGTVADEAAGGTLPDDDVVYQINTFGADFTVDGLIRRFDRGDIYRPDFQRNYVWNLNQASKFIESILLGLPIPSVFLYREEESQQHLIVDGLQRLTTLHSYAEGVFPLTERAFRLKGVKRQFEGRSLRDLASEDRRRFEDSVIHAMIIQQASPQHDKSSVFHIFERLNSNGTPLEPQEMRAAIYHGSFQRLLFDLNRAEAWRLVFGPIHKRSKDEELILRFLAFLYDEQSYVSPMKLFLNNFMGANQNLSESVAEKAGSDFVTTIARIVDAVGPQAFRISRSLNAAIFDSFAVAVARKPDKSSASIGEAYESLLRDPEYIELVSKATANERNVEGRFALAQQALDATP
jgi:hypothetical protein